MLKSNLYNKSVAEGDLNDQQLDKYLLFVIILAGTILRTWDLFNIPYTHDELSAIIRTHFANFHELIEQGVKVDGHPAGIQVFLFYWIKLFGEKEWIVKLPFIFSGILSIPLVYLLGRRWFNSSAGLISAAFLASLQYPIMHSQTARPYSMGLFLVLAMVYCWDKIVFTKKKKNLWYFAYIFFSIASAYNHHFSLLMTFIIGLSGLFLIHKNEYFLYIVSGITIFLLYIPHLAIFSAQLRLKGLGWLGKPEWCFPFDYIKYIFHFSWIEAGMIIVIMITITDFSWNILASPKWRLSFAWFVIPLLIGFFYSTFIKPVLEYSVLLFSFPFLLFCIFARVKWLRPTLRIAIIILILTVSSLTLIIDRQHYKVFYRSVFKELPVEVERVYKNKGKGGCTIIMEGDHKKIGYYISRFKFKFPFVWADSFPSKSDFIKYLHTVPQKTIVLASFSSSDPVNRSLIEDEFPYLQEQKDYFTGNFFIFSKDSAAGHKAIIKYASSNNFDNENQANWSTIFPEYLSDLRYTSAYTSYKLTEKMEWGPRLSLPVKDFISSKTDWLDISVNIYCSDSLPPDIVLVANLTAGNKQIYWNASDLRDFWIQPGWNKLYLSLKLSDLPLKRKNLVFNTFLWNKGLSNLFIDDYKISIINGNPLVYSLYYKIE
jgi:Dolichyl-phosphate-mannose-protein mannosyltransferase